MVHFGHFSHPAAHSDVNVSAFKTQYKSGKNDDTHPMTAPVPFTILNRVCRWFKCAGDGFDNNLIEMSTAKMKRQNEILSLFNQTLKTALPPQPITQSDDFRPAETSAHVTEGIH